MILLPPLTRGTRIPADGSRNFSLSIVSARAGENGVYVSGGARRLKHSRTARESGGGRALSGGYLEIRTRPVNISIEYRISFASIYRAIRVRAPEGILKIQTTCRPGAANGGWVGVGRRGSGRLVPFQAALSTGSRVSIRRGRPMGTSALIRLLRDQR